MKRIEKECGGELPSVFAKLSRGSLMGCLRYSTLKVFLLTPPLTAPENFHVFTINQVDTTVGMGWGGAGVGCYQVLKRKCFQVKHVKMEFTRKACGLKTHGTQCIDRKWSSLKKFIQKELASKRSNGGLNAQIQEYMYSFLWCCNNTV